MIGKIKNILEVKNVSSLLTKMVLEAWGLISFILLTQKLMTGSWEFIKNFKSVE